MVNGNGYRARFSRPSGLLVASDGTLFVSDSDNRIVRQLSDSTVASVERATASDDPLPLATRWPYEPANAAREIAGTFSAGKQDIASVIDEGKATIGSELAQLVTSTSSMLEARATDFAERLVSGRDAIAGVLEEDLRKLEDSRASINQIIAGHTQMLAESRQLTAYRHDGFWQAMDTKREHLILEKLWASGSAPWAKDRS